MRDAGWAGRSTASMDPWAASVALSGRPLPLLPSQAHEYPPTAKYVMEKNWMPFVHKVVASRGGKRGGLRDGSVGSSIAMGPRNEEWVCLPLFGQMVKANGGEGMTTLESHSCFGNWSHLHWLTGQAGQRTSLCDVFGDAPCCFRGFARGKV